MGIKELGGKYRIKDLCKAAGISESGYYKWENKAVAADKDESLYKKIKDIKRGWFKESYGYRKIRYELKEREGIEINHKKVYRIMVKYNLLSKIGRKKSSNYRMMGEGFINISCCS